MKPHIKKVAVLGSGVMGSRIACHFANIGIPVLLLDIPSPDAKPDDKKSVKDKFYERDIVIEFEKTLEYEN